MKTRASELSLLQALPANRPKCQVLQPIGICFYAFFKKLFFFFLNGEDEVLQQQIQTPKINNHK
jgi:hypothetical protein